MFTKEVLKAIRDITMVLLDIDEAIKSCKPGSYKLETLRQQQEVLSDTLKKLFDNF